MSPASSTTPSTDFALRRLRPIAQLPARELDGERVLVDPRNRKVFVLNKVGGVVWDGVGRHATAQEIVSEVVRRFRVETAQAEADVRRFMDELEAAGLAVPVEEAR